MKVLHVFLKSMKENVRDWKILITALVFGPFFVMLYYFAYGNTVPSYHVIVYNQDKEVVLSDGADIQFGAGLIKELRNFKVPDSDLTIKVTEMSDLGKARQMVINKEADLLLEIPEDFSQTVKKHSEGEKNTQANLKLYGNSTNPKYIMAASIAGSIAQEYAAIASGINVPIAVTEELLEKRKIKNDFDYSVPGLIILSVIMILFTASASIIKEIDKGTIKRLQISRMTTFDFLVGISIVQVIITFFAMALTIFTAIGFGFKPAGKIFDAAIIGFLACMSVMAISLIVASLLKSIFDLMTIGTFPWFILAFFSGGMFPLPQIKVFEFGGRAFNLTDILPTSHAVAAMNKILNFGMGLQDLVFEVVMILVLTIFYFMIGLWLFRRRHMKAAY